MQAFVQRYASAIILVLFIAGVLFSLIQGAHQPLPSISLDSYLLLHLERAVLFVAVVYVLYVLITYTSAGRIPNQLGGVSFQDLQKVEHKESEAIKRAQQQLVVLKDQIEDHRKMIDSLALLFLVDRSQVSDTIEKDQADE